MSTKEPQVHAPLTSETPSSERIAGQGPILNGGAINIRLTNPSLFTRTLISGVVSILMGVNFLLGAIPGGIIPAPTFFIYDQSNYVWATCFLILGVGQLAFLTVIRNLETLRAVLGLAALYLLVIAMGTSQPALEGTGSLQLPLLYTVWGVLLWAMIIESFINPWTARRDI